MPIVDEVSAQLKQAMRARDKARTGALRNIRAAFIAGMKEDGAETLSDEKAQSLLRRLAKQRHESITAFEAGGRDEMAAEERAELQVIETFLPKLADADTTRAWVTEAVAKSGAAGMKDLGKVMGLLMKDHKAELDGKLASKLVKEALS